MEWTFEKPTKPGRYIIAPFRNQLIVERIVKERDRFVIYPGNGPRAVNIDEWPYGGPWFGPIPDPPERKEK